MFLWDSKLKIVYFSLKLNRNLHETSRDFQQFPLIENKQATLEISYQEFCKIRTEKFFDLHANEEELNSEFIKIY